MTEKLEHFARIQKHYIKNLTNVFVHYKFYNLIIISN